MCRFPLPQPPLELRRARRHFHLVDDAFDPGQLHMVHERVNRGGGEQITPPLSKPTLIRAQFHDAMITRNVEEKSGA